MDHNAIAALLKGQEGVISRRQVIAAGGCDNDIARLLRRRLWARVEEGVYVNHTGPLSWEQRAWAGVLFAWPAALDSRTALRACRVRQPSRFEQPDAVIHVAVASHFRRDVPDWLRVRRLDNFEGRVQPHLSPPRVRLEEALLVVASRSLTEAAALGVLADACQTGASTPERLAGRLRQMIRLRRRRFLLHVLGDVAQGAYSVLEHRYLKDVERPHGLPTARRQRRVSTGRTVAYRDVEYVGLATIVELDGRLGHEETSDRWADLDRDLSSAVDGDLTLRAGWAQVLEPCRLSGIVGSILVARGWTGSPKPCAASCPLGGGDDGTSPPAAAGDPPLSA